MKPVDRILSVFRLPRSAFLRLAFSLQLSAFSLSVVPVASATETTDLGQNLSYLRVEELSDVAKAITSVVPENRALVLDLRYSAASGDSVKHLANALAARKGPAPLFILVSPGTPAPLAAALEKLPPGAITLGIKEANPAPRLVVAQPPEVDRRAHAALDSGLPVAALISGKVEKERYDEASLVRDFSSGTRDPRPPVRTLDNTEPEPFGEPGVHDNVDSTDLAPILTDRVLQRAVHLHRTLFALRAR